MVPLRNQNVPQVISLNLSVIICPNENINSYSNTSQLECEWQCMSVVITLK